VTALQLLVYIVAAIAIQLAAGLGVAFWRWRRARSSSAASTGEARTFPAPAWTGWRDFRVTLRTAEDPSGSQCSFYLQPVDRAPLPTYLPGQFLTFDVPASNSSGGSGSLTRCYSLSDKPASDGYRVTIKRALAPPGSPNAPPGVASAYFHDVVREGHVLRVKAPSGQFCLDPDPEVPSILIAGGVGITPMMSMLLWARAEQPGRAIHLYYGVRNSTDQAFRKILEDLAAENSNFHLTVVYERPLPADVEGRDYQYSGYIDIGLLSRTSPTDVWCRYYVCGPPPMMASLVPALRTSGIPETDIRFEAFGPASLESSTGGPRSALAQPIDVRFERSKRTLGWDGLDATLLDFAERKGIAMESGCRSGSCGTCETRIVSGTVRNTQAGVYEVAAGHCLPCISEPESALVLDA
jgi:ferredoxin-NADP reductase